MKIATTSIYTIITLEAIQIRKFRCSERLVYITALANPGTNEDTIGYLWEPMFSVDSKAHFIFIQEVTCFMKLHELNLNPGSLRFDRNQRKKTNPSSDGSILDATHLFVDTFSYHFKMMTESTPVSTVMCSKKYIFCGNPDSIRRPKELGFVESIHLFLYFVPTDLIDPYNRLGYFKIATAVQHLLLCPEPAAI